MAEHGYAYMAADLHLIIPYELSMAVHACQLTCT